MATIQKAFTLAWTLLSRTHHRHCACGGHRMALSSPSSSSRTSPTSPSLLRSSQTRRAVSALSRRHSGAPSTQLRFLSTVTSGHCETQATALEFQPSAGGDSLLALVLEQRRHVAVPPWARRARVKAKETTSVATDRDGVNAASTTLTNDISTPSPHAESYDSAGSTYHESSDLYDDDDHDGNAYSDSCVDADALPPLVRTAAATTTTKLILDPVQWLSEAGDAPLMNIETLREHITEAAFNLQLFDTYTETADAATELPPPLSASSTLSANVSASRAGASETVVMRSASGHTPTIEVDATEMLVFNVFTRRVVAASSASVRSLFLLGIAVDTATRELVVERPEALQLLARELRARRCSWPARWSRGVLFRQIQRVLCDETVTDPVGRTEELMRIQYMRMQERQRALVLSPVTGTKQQAQTANSSGVVAVAEGTDDGLFTLADLNAEQQQVVRLVMDGYHTYIGGGAGTGKSVLLRVLKQHLAKEGLMVAVTGTTGISGHHIGGSTLHRCFGINILGEFTRRKELAAYDVVIIDEVSMLSRELFESLERHLRRANGVDLPFGGVQMILCGDFMQLGAIASEPLITSPVFRRNFTMFKLMTVVRHNTSPLFAEQLQQLRRGSVPAGLQDSVQFLTAESVATTRRQELELRSRQRRQLSAIMKGPSIRMDGTIGGERVPKELPAAQGPLTADDAELIPRGDTYVENAVNLLPTNQQVEETNRRELERLPGEATVFPAQVLSPSLLGCWSPTYILRMHSHKVDTRKLALEVEHFAASYFSKNGLDDQSATWAAALLGNRNIVLYPLFVDALALRVRVPAEFDKGATDAFLTHLSGLDKYLEGLAMGIRVRDVIQLADGLHSEADEYALESYASRSPMARPVALKIGARVMLRVNIGPGLVNGSLGIVVGFRRLAVEELPQYIAGNEQRAVSVHSYTDFLCYEHGFPTALAPEVDFGGGRIEVIPPTTFYVGGLSNTHHYSLGVIALPLSLAYAFTVHKVQGLTLVGRVHLELSRMWPCEHLLYVAMSRVRNPEQLSISNFDERLVCAAADCLLFDDSLPTVWEAKVPSYLTQATWRRSPERRKRSVRRRQVAALQDSKTRQRREAQRRARAEMDAEVERLQEAQLKLIHHRKQ